MTLYLDAAAAVGDPMTRRRRCGGEKHCASLSGPSFLSFSPSNSFDLWFDERHGFRHSFGTATAATAFLPLFVFLLLIPPTLEEVEALFCGDPR